MEFNDSSSLYNCNGRKPVDKSGVIAAQRSGEQNYTLCSGFRDQIYREFSRISGVDVEFVRGFFERKINKDKKGE